MDIYGDDDSIYNRFLNANPPTAQTEIPVSARFEDFSGFLLDAVDEDPEIEEEPVDGVVVVDGIDTISLTTPK